MKKQDNSLTKSSNQQYRGSGGNSKKTGTAGRGNSDN